MSSATIILTILLTLGSIFFPRRYFLLPYILAACLVPMNQRILIGGLDFTVLRILVLTGMIRCLFLRDKTTVCWHGFDKLVLAWNISSSLVYTIQFGTMSAFLNRCGVMYDSLGMYLICRHYFQSFEDIAQTIKQFAVCAIIATPFVAAEKFTEKSIFSIFGPTGAAFHRGRFRCAGPFPHFIMLGCFWASLVPLFNSLRKAQISPMLNSFAILSAVSLVYFSASSTPLLTLVTIFLFWMLYDYRQYGNIILLTVVITLTALHLVMDAPVWHLISRLNIFGGSTGWHRYYLFDQFIEHASEWFFWGTADTAHWGLGLIDITNQYVLEAVRGGIFTLFIFCLMLYKAVKISGRCSLTTGDPSRNWIAWGICVSLLGHIISFWGVSYFGQILMLLYMTLAMVGSINAISIKTLQSGVDNIYAPITLPQEPPGRYTHGYRDS